MGLIALIYLAYKMKVTSWKIIWEIVRGENLLLCGPFSLQFQEGTVSNNDLMKARMEQERLKSNIKLRVFVVKNVRSWF